MINKAIFLPILLLVITQSCCVEATTDEHTAWWLRLVAKYPHRGLDTYKGLATLSPENFSYQSRDTSPLHEVIEAIKDSPYLIGHPHRDTIIDCLRVMWRFSEKFPITHLAGIVFVDEDNHALIIHNIRDHQEPSCYFDSPVVLQINLEEMGSWTKWSPFAFLIGCILAVGFLLFLCCR